MNQGVARGDIWWADLGKTVGSEQKGRRPVIVVQNDTGNARSPTAVCVPLSGVIHPGMPTHVPLKRTDKSGLWYDSTALCEQVRTLDMRRFEEKMGSLGGRTPEVDRALMVSVGLEKYITMIDWSKV